MSSFPPGFLEQWRPAEGGALARHRRQEELARLEKIIAAARKIAERGGLRRNDWRGLESVINDLQRLVSEALSQSLDLSGRARDNYLRDMDRVSGLPRRAPGLVSLQAHMDSALQRGENLYLVFADEQGLKSWNDNFSHAWGDAVLANDGLSIREHLDDGDDRGVSGHALTLGGGNLLMAFSGPDLTEETVREIAGAVVSDGRRRWAEAWWVEGLTSVGGPVGELTFDERARLVGLAEDELAKRGMLPAIQIGVAAMRRGDQADELVKRAEDGVPGRRPRGVRRGAGSISPSHLRADSESPPDRVPPVPEQLQPRVEDWIERRVESDDADVLAFRRVRDFQLNTLAAMEQAFRNYPSERLEIFEAWERMTRDLIRQLLQAELHDFASDWQPPVDPLEQPRMLSPLRGLRDSMTGMLDRSAGMQWAARTISKAQAEGRPVVIVQADINGLGDVADRVRGDEMVKATGQALVETAGRFDGWAFRDGGDEFVAVLDGVTLEQASDFDTLVQERLAALDPDARVTVGMAEMQDGESVLQVRARADEQMYKIRRAADPNYGKTSTGRARPRIKDFVPSEQQAGPLVL